MMTFVVPMAGRGERFLRAGFNCPKMLIEKSGKTLLQWSVDSLPLELCSQLVFVLLEDHQRRHDIVGLVRSLYGHKVVKLEFVFLRDVTRGQAETVLACRDVVGDKAGLLVYNIDTAFVSRSLSRVLVRDDVDGVLGGFRSDSPKYSYARLGGNGDVVELAEKVVISDMALTGLYHFKKASDLFDVVASRIDQGVMEGGEYYIAPLYNDLISQGKRIVMDVADWVGVMGTPDELSRFTPPSRER